jgi:hypothetical protein
MKSVIRLIVLQVKMINKYLLFIIYYLLFIIYFILYLKYKDNLGI